jgi:hypothetical protein
MKTSKVHMSMGATQVRAFTFDEFPNATIGDLAKLGITMNENDLGIRAAMDAAPNMVTNASVATPLQFLQWWMPSMIEVITRARRADAMVGRSIVASWEDEEVVVTVKESIGQPQPYGDLTDVPLVSYNTNFVKRTNVRFEAGIQTGKLEDARAAKMKINPYNEKRAALAGGVAIGLNEVAFYGFDSYNADTNPNGGNTYGILNAPELPSAGTLAATGTGSARTFASKDYAAICADFTTIMSALRVQTGDNWNPETDGWTCAIATSAFQYLDTQNELGTQSVREFIQKQYKGVRFLSVPELDNMGGAGVHGMYIIADSLNGRKCCDQLVTAALRLLGVEPKIKGTLEGYTYSTAGFVAYQPLGVLRYTGV